MRAPVAREHDYSDCASGSQQQAGRTRAASLPTRRKSAADSGALSVLRRLRLPRRLSLRRRRAPDIDFVEFGEWEKSLSPATSAVTSAATSGTSGRSTDSGRPAEGFGLPASEDRPSEGFGLPRASALRAAAMRTPGFSDFACNAGDVDVPNRLEDAPLPPPSPVRYDRPVVRMSTFGSRSASKPRRERTRSRLGSFGFRSGEKRTRSPAKPAARMGTFGGFRSADKPKPDAARPAQRFGTFGGFTSPVDKIEMPECEPKTKRASDAEMSACSFSTAGSLAPFFGNFSGIADERRSARRRARARVTAEACVQ